MTQFVQNVATNVCGTLPNTIPVNLDCSLCAIGFPQYGGMIGITFYGPRCLPEADPSPSYWLGYETKYAMWQCPNPGQDNEPEPNKWIATGYFGGATADGCSNQYRFDAELNAIDETHITVDVTVYVLVATEGGCTWSQYITWSESLTEIVNADTTRYRGRNFSSPDYVSITPNLVGGKGDPVQFVKSTIGMQSFKLGCGSTGNALPVCGFWDGTQWLTCFRGVIRSTSDYSIRDFSQFGFNPAGCGGVGAGGYCYCDTINLTSVAPPLGTTTYNADPQFVTDYGVIGVPGEAIGAVQQLQVDGGSNYGIQVVVKQINGGAIYICTNDNGAGWICTVANVGKDKGPRILTATRADFEVWLYCLNFPNENILPEECGNGGDYPTPDPETDPYWCTPTGCEQSPLQPADAIGGPYATLGECETACAEIPPPNPPWWCVENLCVQSDEPPLGYTGGPYASQAICQAAGCEPPPPEGDYWCLYGNCVQSPTQPDPAATGPYATSGECVSECPGPAEMVWRCTDAGCGTLSRSGAIMGGYVYYLTQAECEEACPVEYYCVDNVCEVWAVGYSPPSFSAGPFATISQCYEECDNGPGWYCLGGVCGNYPARPPGAYGPRHDTYQDCVADCAFVVESVSPSENISQPAAIQITTQPVIQPRKIEQKKPVQSTKVKKTMERINVPCIHLGGNLESLASCGCNKKNVLKECALYGKARVYGLTKSDDEKVCFSCPSYQPSINK